MESGPPQPLSTGVQRLSSDPAAAPTAPARTSSLAQQPTRSARSVDRPFIEAPPQYHRRAPGQQPGAGRNPREQFAAQSYNPGGMASTWDDSSEDQHYRVFIPDTSATAPAAAAAAAAPPRQRSSERGREMEERQRGGDRDRDRTVRPVYSARGIQHRDTYPPDSPSSFAAEPQTPLPSAARGGQRGAAVGGTGPGGARPPTVSFYDARDYMHSGGGQGRRARPDSWSSGSLAAKGSSSPLVEPTPPSSKRPPPDLESGLDGRSEPPMRPPTPLDQDDAQGRLPWVLFLNSPFKNHVVATLGEFVGTTMFLFFAFSGTMVSNAVSDQIDLKPAIADAATAALSLQRLVYISLSFGFSLMVNVWIFFRISGGLFNPAVSYPMLFLKEKFRRCPCHNRTQQLLLHSKKSRTVCWLSPISKLLLHYSSSRLTRISGHAGSALYWRNSTHSGDIPTYCPARGRHSRICSHACAFSYPFERQYDTVNHRSSRAVYRGVSDC
jgi:hypothetical protein